MVGPTVTPENGVTRYQYDRTQGPACAIAAGAATIYRNYFAPVCGRSRQTAEYQLDGLADLGEALSIALNRPVNALWKMQNGYALCTREGLDAIAEYLGSLQPEQLDALRGKLRVGIHRDVEVTSTAKSSAPSLASLLLCLAGSLHPCHIPIGNRSRLSFCKQRMKPQCGRPRLTQSAARQMLFSSHFLAVVLLAITIAGLTTPCGVLLP